MLRACSALAALSAAAAVPESSGSASGWKLQMLHDAAEQDGAVCLDGTVSSIVPSSPSQPQRRRCAAQAPGYYIRPGVGADAKNFKIHFKGGGWCFDDKSCLGRSKQWLGSSKQWGPVPAGTAGDPTKNPSEGVQGLLNNNASNPFGRWTAIFVE